MKNTIKKVIQAVAALLLLILALLLVYYVSKTQGAASVRNLAVAIAILAACSLLLILKQSVQAFQVLFMNREQKEQVFWDEHTQLPNKNKCEEVLSRPGAVQEATVVYMFDLNNLKYVNANFGREAGDQLITNFAQIIRASVPEQFFVGRYGGDEFIAIVTGEDCQNAGKIVSAVEVNADAFNQASPETTIRYSAGYASSADAQGYSLQALFVDAEKDMYKNKRQAKKKPMEFEEELDASLQNMIQALGREYTDCCYCNAQTGGYHLFGGVTGSNIPRNGSVKAGMMWLSCLIGDRTERASFLEKLSIPYISAHLDEKHISYDVTCHFRGVKRNWWKLTAVYVDSEAGKLHHFLLLFKEISGEKELEFEAKHDGLTGLWNKTTAFELMSEKINEHGKQYNMLVFDLDDFKHVNDTMGHTIGDAVIKKTAEIIRSQFRDSDVVARFGGDEFFAFAEGDLSNEVLKAKADYIMKSANTYFDQTYKLSDATISIGIAVTHQQMSASDLFHKADDALYAAKRQGKNQSVLMVDGDKVV